MRVAVVQKCPNRVKYTKELKIDNLEVFSLSSTKVTRLLKRDVDLNILELSQYNSILEHLENDNPNYTEEDLGFCPELYDYVILVGSEALKMFTKATAVTDYTGKIAPSKPEYENTPFIAAISPAVLAFKPEAKPVWEQTVDNISSILSGKTTKVEEGDYVGLTTTKSIRKYLKMVLDNPQWETIGLDSETSALAPRDGYVLGICVSHDERQGIYADALEFDEECINLLQEIIDSRAIVLHNAKFDMKFLMYHLGLDFVGRDIHDTMLQHYILDERIGHGLKSLTMKYGHHGDYDRELDEFKKKYCKDHKMKAEDFSYDLIPWDIMVHYSAIDPAATITIHNKFLPIIENNPKLKALYYNVMLPGMHFLTRIEERGIPISIDRLNAAKELLEGQLEQLKLDLYSYDEVKEIEAERGEAFNSNSVQQIRTLLFDKFGIEPTNKLTATGNISTDADVLKELAEVHEVPGLILDIRQKTKLISTYIDKLIPAMDSDKKVRTGFNQCTTTSGRLSSSGKFNFQQLPARDMIIKGCIKAPEGYRIVALDMTTAEVWVAACLSGDKNMQQVFIDMNLNKESSVDFHSATAHMVFNLPCEPWEVKKKFPEMRQASKAVMFSLLYGSGAKNVAETVNKELLEVGKEPTCTVKIARGYFNDFFTRFPQLKIWMDKCHRKIKAEGYIYSHFGRKRRLHNINSSDKGVAAGEVRSGFNAIIQSPSSDILLLGAIDADKEIMEKGLDAGIIGLVHDSIVAVVRIDLVEEYTEIVTRHVQTDRGIMIPNAPMGLEADTEPGGSLDYSGGKYAKQYPQFAEL